MFEDVSRVEAWSFFEPPPEGGDPDYVLGSNRARLGVHVDARRISFEGSFQYAQLLGLPKNAFGPGPLGPGAMYFFSAATPQAYQLYFKSMSVRIKDIVPHLSLAVGRMPYHSGEGTPFAGRLIGNAEWTPFERAFDGARLDYSTPEWAGHGSFVMPTQGGFEESASPTIGRLQLATGSISTRGLSVFAHNYRDTRAVYARPDNTGIAVEAVDINMQTIGASWSGSMVEAWGAIQRGRWYEQPHRAFSVSAEVGHQWRGVAWRPAVHGGVLYATGDSDPNDDRHGTFFPMVPTTRPDVLGGTYAQMNLRDVYANVVLHPRDRLTVALDIHQLSLADRLDRWYSGTGATQFDGGYFGFSTRRSTLRTGLGTLLQVSATSALKEQWMLKGSVAMVRGGDVVRRQFDGSTLLVLAFESVVSFR